MTATSTIDAAAGVVRAEIEIAASPERVFRALTDPRELASWGGAPDTYQTYDRQVDLRPGGAWSCKARGANSRVTSQANEDFTVGGEYRVIDPPRRLEYTWLSSWAPIVTHVRIDIEPTAGGSRVVVNHTGFPGEEA